MAKRTPTDDTAKATRCKATEGAQQCLKAQHPKFQNHTWGSRGATKEWNADGTPRVVDFQFVAANPGPATEDLAVTPPRDGEQADPDPHVTLRESGDALEPSDTGVVAGSAGSGDGGSGRSQTILRVEGDPLTTQQAEGIKRAMSPPSTGRSIGRVIANTAVDAALGVPTELQDERAHGREATEILLEAAAEHWRREQFMPVERLLDLQAVIDHMVDARGVGR
jgi:hypothetical protein